MRSTAILLLLTASMAYGQRGNFSYGSDRRTVHVDQIVTHDEGWHIMDMDEGTRVVLKKGSYRLGVHKKKGLIWIVSGVDHNGGSLLTLNCDLPIAIPPDNRVEVYCPPGRYVHMTKPIR